MLLLLLNFFYCFGLILSLLFVALRVKVVKYSTLSFCADSGTVSSVLEPIENDNSFEGKLTYQLKKFEFSVMPGLKS